MPLETVNFRELYIDRSDLQTEYISSQLKVLTDEEHEILNKMIEKFNKIIRDTIGFLRVTFYFSKCGEKSGFFSDNDFNISQLMLTLDEKEMKCLELLKYILSEKLSRQYLEYSYGNVQNCILYALVVILFKDDLGIEDYRDLKKKIQELEDQQSTELPQSFLDSVQARIKSLVNNSIARDTQKDTEEQPSQESTSQESTSQASTTQESTSHKITLEEEIENLKTTANSDISEQQYHAMQEKIKNLKDTTVCNKKASFAERRKCDKIKAKINEIQQKLFKIANEKGFQKKTFRSPKKGGKKTKKMKKTYKKSTRKNKNKK